MRIGEINQNNYLLYQDMLNQFNKANGGTNAAKRLDTVRLSGSSPGISFAKPNWSTIMTRPDQPAMSEEEFEAAIRAQAQRDFEKGNIGTGDEFHALLRQYVSVVSPDRKASYEQAMQASGGKMVAGGKFFDGKGNYIMHYNQWNRLYLCISTPEETARRKQFVSIYNSVMDGLLEGGSV